MSEIGASEKLAEKKEAQNPENPLAQAIEKKVKIHGTIPFDQYMSACNYGLTDEGGETHPGFYNSESTVIGGQFSSYTEKSGKRDFTTLPEQTPLFGFLMAKQIVEMWEALDRDEDFKIVEMGAGNGTMAYDILHGLRYFAPEMQAKYTIVEQSPELVKKQRERLKDFDVEIIEASAVEQLPENVTGVFISNELLDDIPAKMVRKKDGRWQELFIGEGGEGKFQEVWTDADSQVSDEADELIGEIDDESIYPLSLQGKEWIKKIASSLKKGFVITADYYKYKGSNGFDVYGSSDKKLELDENGNIEYLSKNNAGQAQITSSPSFRALHKSGAEEGLKTEVDVTLGGFAKSFDSNKLSKDLWDEFLMEKPFPEAKVLFGSGRDYEAYTARMKVATSNFRVLIQSKDIETVRLTGGKYTFTDEAMDLGPRDGFKPVDN